MPYRSKEYKMTMKWQSSPPVPIYKDLKALFKTLFNFDYNLSALKICIKFL